MNTTALGQFNIAEVDSLEVLSLVDNSVDYLSTIDKKRHNLLENGRDNGTVKNVQRPILNCLLLKQRRGPLSVIEYS